jgi:hypothetical protein
MPARSICAGLVEETLADILPDRALPVEPDRVCLLDFDDPQATLTLDAQDVLLDIGEGALLDRLRELCFRSRIGEHGLPHLIRHGIAWGRVMRRAISSRRSLTGQFLHLFGFGHAPARRSIRHAHIRTKREHKV